MNKFPSKIPIAGLGVAIFALAGPVAAEEAAGDFTVTSNISLYSDYVARGVTNSDSKPALQGSVKLAHNSGLYVSAWASNARFEWMNNDIPGAKDSPDIEVDLSAGWGAEFENGLSVDVGILRYLYPGVPSYRNMPYTEFYAGMGYKIDDLNLSGKYYYSPSFTLAPNGESASYVTATAEYALPYEVKIGASYGHSFGSAFRVLGTSSYDDYRIGVSKDISGVVASLNWYDTNSRGKQLNGSLADGRLVVGLSKDF
ncbi:MAG: hypothetical protein HQL60_06190 [Magnetococcales bacterium]|nr:hypothetical protein [Magnetococcales bacterium]